jgi:hypothetical protein
MTEDFPPPPATCHRCSVTEQACNALKELFAKPCCPDCFHPTRTRRTT